MSTSIKKVARVGWKLSVDEVEETKDGGINYVAVVSGADTDRDGDQIDQDSLESQWDTYQRNPVLLYMHSWLGTAGHALEFARDGDRSMVKFYLGHGYKFPTIYGTDVHVDDLRAQVLQRSLRSKSIAFNGTRIQEDGEKSGRVKVDDWMETSIVVIPSFKSGQIIDETIRSYMKMLRGDVGEIEKTQRAVAEIYDLHSSRTEDDASGSIRDLIEQVAAASDPAMRDTVTLAEADRASLVRTLELFKE